MSKNIYYHTFSILLTKFFSLKKIIPQRLIPQDNPLKLPSYHFLGAGGWEDHEDGGGMS
jgi:hypothetical protein